LEEIFARTPRFDLAIVCVKAFDTVTAIQALRPYADRIDRILTPQNGVSNEDLLGVAFGRSKIISGTVLNPIAVPEIGAVRLEKAGRGVGLAPVEGSIENYVEALRSTQLPVRTYADYRAMKWSKLILNLLGNATSAILDMPTRETFADPRVFKIEAAMLREALAVMRAQSIGTVDLPGSPVRLLAFGIRFAPIFILQRILQPSGRRARRQTALAAGGHAQRQNTIGDRRVERGDRESGKNDRAADARQHGAGRHRARSIGREDRSRAVAARCRSPG
jgi:2-dehydropantoate 2-reductase